MISRIIVVVDCAGSTGCIYIYRYTYSSSTVVYIICTVILYVAVVISVYISLMHCILAVSVYVTMLYSSTVFTT